MVKTVEGVYVHFLRFTNPSNIPIYQRDIASKNPFKLVVSEGKVLDIKIVQVTREVCNISVSKIKSDEEKTIASINFDFLVKNDGAIIQILSDLKKTTTILYGTIIGIPDGLTNTDDMRPKVLITKFGCILPIIIFFICLITALIVYRMVMGGWAKVWLLSLPLVALIPALTFLLAFANIYSKIGNVKFPEILNPPEWYNSIKNNYLKRPVDE